MHPNALSALGVLLLLTAAGCDIKMLKPLVAGFSDDQQQECVEAALRGDPDTASLPGALSRFTRGCDTGDPAACSALGVMYETGHQVPMSASRAFELYDAACKADNDVACVNLGVAYANGLGTRVNAHKAVALFKLGCDGGSERACTELASMHARGDGVARNPQLAAGLLQTACHNGQPESCYRLAVMFEGGTLGPDPARSLGMYEMSCAFGKRLGCERVNALYAQMRK